ncbi:unnamed protein product [Linum trigynum]|uniref:Uncharacterized protein n=1 Tax=Linum trigynum TaxID=586398 RepID=A0AAV2FEI2_9ROSI
MPSNQLIDLIPTFIMERPNHTGKIHSSIKDAEDRFDSRPVAMLAGKANRGCRSESRRHACSVRRQGSLVSADGERW